MGRVGCVLASIAAVTWSGAVLATNVYDESAFGDFHGGQVLSLIVGANTVTGVQGPGFSDPVDGFRFDIPSGHVGHIDFVGTFTGLSPGADLAWVWELHTLADLTPCTPNLSPYECVSGQFPIVTAQIFESTPGFVDTGTWPFVDFAAIDLAAGAYVLADNFSFGNGDFASGLFSYAVTVSVAPVPLPAAVWLLGSGLGMVAWLRRGRSASA